MRLEPLAPDVAGLIPASRGLAQARENFLRLESIDSDGVREAIMASWWRSRQSNVDADRLDLQYVRDPNLDTPLTRSAEPVLCHLQQQLEGQALAIVLTDPAGIVLTRMTTDLPLERQLDHVSLAPGFDYSEQVVGTNGIGTALEAGQPVHVFGHEHYAENLEELACAGVPIRHPVTGKTVGALDLTCWRRDASPLLMTLAKTTAEQIRQALLAEAGVREIELLQAYLRACRHSTGLVFALNNDVVMMNEAARSTLGAADQEALLLHASEALSERRDSVGVELPSGVQVRLKTRPVNTDGRVAGGVIDVHVIEATAARSASGRHPARMLLPGVVGSGTLWRRACADLEAAYQTHSWLIVEGESGVGKLTVLRALHQRMDPNGRSGVLDAAEAAGDPTWTARACQSLDKQDGTVVLRHLELLTDRSLRLLKAAIQVAQHQDDVWIAVAVTGQPPRPELQLLLDLFPLTVRVPPLRHHVEDVEQLVPFFLRRLAHGSQLTCSPEAMQLLLRFPWPGNVAQVLDTLRYVLRTRRSGVLQASDLPPELRARSRRRLGALESMERDAISLALLDAGGNKAQAARALGMSRATIYRKVHEYGIPHCPT
jgi:transcriptional regulator of acetoin/glycerol metabolism